jgi:hypothetical protein
MCQHAASVCAAEARSSLVSHRTTAQFAAGGGQRAPTHCRDLPSYYPSTGEHAAVDVQQLMNPKAGSFWKSCDENHTGRAELIRSETRRDFVFPFITKDVPDATFTARFTDDADLHWEIDDDLRLQKLPHRDW